MSEKNTIVHMPGERQLSPGEIRKLAESLSAGIAEIPQTFISRTRQTLRELIHGIPLLRHTIGKPRIKQMTFPYPGIREINERDVSSIGALEQAQSLYVATRGENVAGIGGLRKYEWKFEGRDIYELCRLTVLPAHRRQGIAEKILDTVFMNAMAQHPDANFVASTKNSAVRRWLLKNAFKELSADEISRLYGDPNIKGIEEWMSRGWRTYRR
jgi:N-acetylglutamate synthase-like GNAT family acetyltransferase